MKISIVLHAHQPPGNFDRVFQRAVDQSYAPVLDLIEERPNLRLSLHYSGSLLEWLVQHRPEHVEQIRRLVQRGQVELVAAGMYEPVLALLPSRDRAAQVLTHRAYLKRLFGVDATSGWLTERVWQQPIAADLVDGGIRTVTLDDRHFLGAGVPPEDLDAPYLTESDGRPLRVVPVAEDLRTAVPWHPVPEAIEVVRLHAAAGERLLVYADDIEKFGMWPGTYEDVIQSGWVGRFFDALIALEGIEVVPLGEAVEAVPHRGRVYLPDGSYPEMLEWSLLASTQRDFRDTRAAIEEVGLLDRAGRFLRAGNYLQYLAKYPEVNYLQKRMHDVSARLAARYPEVRERRHHDLDAWEPERTPEALLDLWRAQANCAYWHGLFGGVYLPHIRQRLWHHLIRAERAVEDPPALRVLDLDADLDDEVVLQSADLTVVVDPGEGAVVEFSDRQGAVNVLDTLARREEGYHDPGALPYPLDRGRRAAFVDRFLGGGRSPGPRAESRDRGDFHGQPYEVQVREPRGGARVALERTASTGRGQATVRKTLRLVRARGLEGTYQVRAAGRRLETRFGVEFNLGLLFTEEPTGELRAGDSTLALPRGGTLEEVTQVTVQMEGIPSHLEWEVDPPAHLHIRPIATVSEAEGAREETPQQMALLLSWPLHIAGDETFEGRISWRLGRSGSTRRPR